MNMMSPSYEGRAGLSAKHWPGFMFIIALILYWTWLG